MSPVRLLCAPRFDPKKEDVRIVRSFGGEASDKLLYKKLPGDFKFTSFEFVENVADADFVLLPQSLRKDTPKWQAYFATQKAFAARHKKELVLFIGTDHAHRMHVDGAIVFKGSAYASRMHENEIVSVPYAEDLSQSIPPPLREKSAKPVISFCGYAGFPDIKTHAKYLIKNVLIDVVSRIIVNPEFRVFKRGIYFRRTAIRALQGSERVETSFIIRDSFSGNTATTRLNPQEARKEYIENMINSDFVLCPKGDGNYSVRFYEALSLGRIPILIDTDMVLPLEKTLDYSRFILRVPHTEISQIASIVADFYASIPNEEFAAMQIAAREIFAKYLRYDSFFNVALPRIKEKGVGSLN